MASGKLRNIYEDNDHYNKAFRYMCSLGDRNGTMERWCQSLLHNDIVPKLNLNIPEGEELRHLGIGSGPGELECLLLRQLLQRFPRISNHVIEPSAEFVAKYKTKIAAARSELQGINFHWHPQTLQKYRKKREEEADKTKFHFISAIHSLYYVDDLGTWLDYLHGLLDEGGVLMVIFVSDSCGLGSIMAEFPKLGSKQKFDFDYSDVNSGDVRRHFDKVGIPYLDLPIPIRYNCTACFAEEPSTEGDLFLDWFSHSIGFRENSDEELRIKFMQFLDSDKCTEKRNDDVYFKGDWDVAIALEGCNNNNKKTIVDL